MPYGLYLSAAGAESQKQRMEVLANNLANVATPGFKRELAIIQARHSEALEQGLDVPGSRSINDVGGGVNMTETATDFSRGLLKRTGIDTDLAINGKDGFFVVEKDGQELLTRAGNFLLGPSGQLQTQKGYSVLGDAGPITIDPTLPWRIFENGVVEQGGAALDRIRLVAPRSLGDLVKVGENFFHPLASPAPLPVEQRHIVSGYLEQSTVQPTAAMMELIETSRAYEANIKMIQNQDHVIGTLVNRVLRQT